METEFQFQCEMCDYEVEAATSEVFYHHVKALHSHSEPFMTFCHLPNCNSRFEQFLSFKRHWYKFHHHRVVPAQQLPPGLDISVFIMSFWLIDKPNFSFLVADHMEPESDSDNEAAGAMEVDFPGPALETINVEHHHPAVLTNKEWISAQLLYLRERFYLPFEALEFVASILKDYKGKTIASIKVTGAMFCVKLCMICC